MSNKKPPKKVGFWYGVGKGWNRVWSGVSGESSSEKRAIENYAKDAILNHMFMSDIRKLVKEFNLPDPEDKIDEETGKVTKKRKTLEEHRKYVKSKIGLLELETYIIRNQHLRDIVNQNGIRTSEIASYAAKVASVREQIHWTITNIINVIKNDNREEMEPTSYANYWTKQLGENMGKFRYAVRQIENSEKKLLRLKFKQEIFTTLQEVSQRCDALYEQLDKMINSQNYSDSDLIGYRTKFNALDDEFFFQLKKIRHYAYGMNITYDSRSKISILIDLRNHINELSLSRFGFELLNQDEKSLEQVSKDCYDNDDLVVNLAAIGTLIDGMNVMGMKLKLKVIPQDGSINTLEEFLKEHIPEYEREIVTNLRTVMKIRNQWPIHKSSAQGVRLIIQVNETYPVDDFEEFWSRLFNLYTESLRGFESTLNDKEAFSGPRK